MSRPITEYRPDGTRNFIRVGDTVAVTPPEKAARFLGKITRILGDDNGQPLEVDVVVRKKMNGDRHKRFGQLRTVRPSQIERVAQTRHQETP